MWLRMIMGADVCFAVAWGLVAVMVRSPAHVGVMVPKVSKPR